MRTDRKIREDGLTIFPDGTDKRLDNIRINSNDKLEVILAVAFTVAKSVSINYSEKYSKESKPQIENYFKEFESAFDKRGYKNLFSGLNPFEF